MLHRVIYFFANNVRSSTINKHLIYINMEIKILGTGCSNCKMLYETVKKAVVELGLDATVLKEEDIMKIMTYNIMSLPALLIDEKIVIAGKKLSLTEIKLLLTK